MWTKVCHTDALRQMHRCSPTLPDEDWSATFFHLSFSTLAARKIIRVSTACLLLSSVLHPTHSSCIKKQDGSWCCDCFFYSAQKPCRRLTLISCASCLSELGEAVSPGVHRPSSSVKFNCFLLTVWIKRSLSEAVKLYITQVVVEPAEGGGEPAASLNRQVFTHTSCWGQFWWWKRKSFVFTGSKLQLPVNIVFPVSSCLTYQTEFLFKPGLALSSVFVTQIFSWTIQQRSKMIPKHVWWILNEAL